MTVQAELDKRSHRLEYFLAIEGIGWQTDDGDVSAGFDGAVFATADLDTSTSLASALGCTVYMGLLRPTGVSDSYDPRSGIYSPGSQRFSIQETPGNFLLDTIKPHYISGTSGTLSSNLEWDSTTVVTVEQWSASQVIWVAGREAIKLGTEAGAGPYTYSNCTRGYLGTQRGRNDNRPTLLSGFSWESGTRVDDWCRFWHQRRVVLYCHVPGEAVGNVVRLYTGIIKGTVPSRHGVVWYFPTTQDITTRMREMHFAQLGSTVSANEFVDAQGKSFNHQNGLEGASQQRTEAWNNQVMSSGTPTVLNPEFALSVRRAMKIKPSSTSWYDSLGLAAAYNYRNRVPGGTAGMRSAAISTPTTPQAVLDSSNRYSINSLLMLGEGQYVRALHKRQQQGATNDRPYTEIMTDISSFDLGTNFFELFDKGVPVRFMLDNYSPHGDQSRFAVNGRVTRNPIDILLMFFTSANNEYKVLDTSGVSTDTTLQFAASSFVANQWNGYALFAVEANVGEARTILSNTTSAITVDRAFTSAPATAKEHQIRNSIYDVLPVGWGLGIPPSRIDIASFEAVREKYMADANVGKFAFGSEDELNIYQFLVDNIAVPYGILIYVDRTTGKLSAAYIGTVTPQDELDGSYVSVTSEDILDIGDIDYMPRTPAGKATLTVRSSKNKALRIKAASRVGTNRTSGRGMSETWAEYEETETSSPTVHGEGIKIPFIVGEKLLEMNDTETDHIKLRAMLDTEKSIYDFLIGRIAGLLKQEINPPPEVSLKLDMSKLLTVQVGTLLNITDTDKWNPVNPFTGSRGWTNLIARVLSTSDDLSETQPGIDCKIQLLTDVTSGRIASACDVDSKAGSGAGNEYFVVHYSADADYSADITDLDWRAFRADDLIELRDITGAFKESLTVLGFGSTKVDDPADALDGRIYVTGTIASTIVAGDYLTFQPWSGSNTTNMELYTAYADSNETLGAGNDAARKYL